MGRYSWYINLASALVSNLGVRRPLSADQQQFTVFICVLFVLPTAYPVDALNMNYAVVAIGGVILIVSLCWLAWGHRHFRGPVSTIV